MLKWKFLWKTNVSYNINQHFPKRKEAGPLPGGNSSIFQKKNRQAQGKWKGKKETFPPFAMDLPNPELKGTYNRTPNILKEVSKPGKIITECRVLCDGTKLRCSMHPFSFSKKHKLPSRGGYRREVVTTFKKPRSKSTPNLELRL